MATVATAADLYNVRNNLSGSYTQVADIDLSGYANWEPIGWWVYEDPIWVLYPFTGSYDGGGYNITGLTINAPSRGNLGLFGHIEGGATLRNIHISGGSVSVSGVIWVGLLVGSGWNLSGASITSCSVDGDVSGDGSIASYMGNLCGQIGSGATISKCWATGTLSGVGYEGGGLIGGVYGGAVNNCYARVSTSGGGSIGGFIGNVDSATILNCYAAGSVSGASDVGGLIGANFGGSSITQCYYDTNVSGRSDTGKGISRTTAQMTSPEDFATTYIDWDFASIWRSDTTYTINAGYPYLAAGFNIWVKKSGVWEPVTGIWVKKGGTWQSISGVWAKKSGSWNPI